MTVLYWLSWATLLVPIALHTRRSYVIRNLTRAKYLTSDALSLELGKPGDVTEHAATLASALDQVCCDIVRARNAPIWRWSP